MPLAYRPPLVNARCMLEDADNEILFSLLGHKCWALASAVVELYLSNSPGQKEWKKHICGVVCLVKDNPKRSYFIRLYDIKKRQLLWEQDLYGQFRYKTPRDFFHTFEAENCHAGLNFASEDEAREFGSTVEKKLRERNNKGGWRSKKTNVMIDDNAGCPTRPRSLPPVPTRSTHLPVPARANVDTGDRFKKSSSYNAKENSKKLTKGDIGSPYDPRHEGHIGWDPVTGFDMNRLNSDMKTLFESVGIRPEDPDVDQGKVDFIYKFVDDNGGIDAVRKEMKRRAPPPPPPPRPAKPTDHGWNGGIDPSPTEKKRRPPPPPPPPQTKPVDVKRLLENVGTNPDNPDVYKDNVHDFVEVNDGKGKKPRLPPVPKKTTASTESDGIPKYPAPPPPVAVGPPTPLKVALVGQSLPPTQECSHPRDLTVFPPRPPGTIRPPPSPIADKPFPFPPPPIPCRPLLPSPPPPPPISCKARLPPPSPPTSCRPRLPPPLPPTSCRPRLQPPSPPSSGNPRLPPPPNLDGSHLSTTSAGSTTTSAGSVNLPPPSPEGKPPPPPLGLSLPPPPPLPTSVAPLFSPSPPPSPLHKPSGINDSNGPPTSQELLAVKLRKVQTETKKPAAQEDSEGLLGALTWALEKRKEHIQIEDDDDDDYDDWDD